MVALKHVPFEEASFEEAQWGEGKGGIAGGGRYEGVRMGISFLDPTLLVGTRLALCCGRLVQLDRSSRERVMTPGLVGCSVICYVKARLQSMYSIDYGSKSSGPTASPVSSHTTVFIRSLGWSCPCQCNQSRRPAQNEKPRAITQAHIFRYRTWT